MSNLEENNRRENEFVETDYLDTLEFRNSLDTLKSRIESFDDEKWELLKLKEVIVELENSEKENKAEKFKNFVDFLSENQDFLEEKEIVELKEIEEFKTMVSFTQSNLNNLQEEIFSGSEKELIHKANRGREIAYSDVEEQVDDIVKWWEKGGFFRQTIAKIAKKAKQW